MKKKISFIGNFFMILSIAFIIQRIIASKVEFRIFSTRILTGIILAGLVYTALVYCYAKLFGLMIEIFNEKSISKSNVIYIYCKTNLYKYLPGNIFHYIGRNQIAVEEGIDHLVLIYITFTEMVFLGIAGILTSVIFAGDFTFEWIDKLNNKRVCFIFVLAGAMVLIVLYRFNKTVKDTLNSCVVQLRRIKTLTAIKLALAYFSIFIINGFLFVLILMSIGDGMQGKLILPLIGLNALSWLIGFLTPGAPAGLGIREAVMTAFLTGIINEKNVLMAVILYRVVTIFGDIMAFIFVSIMKGIKK